MYMLQGNHTLHKESEKFQTGVRKDKDSSMEMLVQLANIFKTAMIKIVQWRILNLLETNGKRENLSKERQNWAGGTADT